MAWSHTLNLVGNEEWWLCVLLRLGAVAACTERVQVGLSVMVLPHRHPVLTAKMLASLDRLCEGRLLVGTGVGWMQEELDALNAPYHQRGALSDDYLQAMNTLRTMKRASYEGRFVQFPPLGCYPKPVQQPHPPLLIGGHSPAALRHATLSGRAGTPLACCRRFGKGMRLTSRTVGIRSS